MSNIRISLLTLFFLFGCGSTNMADNKVNKHIGIAKMLDDGSITLNLRAEEVDGNTVGHGFFVYKQDDPDYEFIKKHLGGIKEGEIKKVPPFPERKKE